MDHKFIKLMVESYYNDKYLNNLSHWKDKSQCISELYNEVVTLIDNVRLEDSSFYFELYNLGKGIQHELIYKLLDEHILDFYYPQIDQYSINEDESFDQFLIKYNNYIEANGDNLDFTKLETINEFDVSGAFVGACALFGLVAGTIVAIPKFYNVISRNAWKIISGLNTISLKVHKFFKEHSTASRVKTILYINTLDTCLKKCGFSSTKDISAYIGFALDRDIVIGEAANQEKCLTKCYFSWMLDQVKLLASSYKVCLQDHGAPIELDAKILFIQRNMKGECEILYKLLEEHYKQYMEVVDYIYKDDPDSKYVHVNAYNDAINSGFGSKPKSSTFTGSNPQFQKQTDSQHRPFPPRDGQGPRPQSTDVRRPFQRQDNTQMRRFEKDSI